MMMRNVWRIFIVLLTASLAHAEDGAHLFILSGQSNMARLDPALTFIPAVESEFGSSNVIVVKDAQGGQPIRYWDKEWPRTGDDAKKIGKLYDRLMKKVDDAILNKQLKTVTFIWMQGERDAKEQNGDVYAASLQRVVNQLQHDLSRDDIHLVIGRLNDSGVNKSSGSDWMKIREIQVAFAESHPAAAWVNTDDLNSGLNSAGKDVVDDLHLSIEGYKELGRRFAAQAIELIRK